MSNDMNPLISTTGQMFIRQMSMLNQNWLHGIIKQMQMIDRIINNLRLFYGPLIPEEKLIEAYTTMRQCPFLENAYTEEEISPILN